MRCGTASPGHRVDNGVPYLGGTPRASARRCATGAYPQLESANRQAGLVYPRVPRTAGLRTAIEDNLVEGGISAVWFDEAPPADTPAWRAWRALQTGCLRTDDLSGSHDWHHYLAKLKGT